MLNLTLQDLSVQNLDARDEAFQEACAALWGPGLEARTLSPREQCLLESFRADREDAQDRLLEIIQARQDQVTRRRYWAAASRAAYRRGDQEMGAFCARQARFHR